MSPSSLEVVDDGGFQSHVLDNPRPTLVLFTSPTCPPCRILARQLPELARELSDGVDIVRCSIESSPCTARAYQIFQVPAFALFDHGVTVALHAGLLSIPAIRSWVHASLRSSAGASDAEGSREGDSKGILSRAFLRSFFSPTIALQACRVAGVVAPTLLLVNHADLVMRHPLSLAVGQKLALNFLVPYLVSSYSAACTAMAKPAATEVVS